MLMLSLLVACSAPAPTVPDTGLELPGEAAWPARTAVLDPPAIQVPKGFGTRRVFLDPGHGHGDNTGTRTAWCEDEEAVALDLASDLAARLRQTGAFEVRLAREGDGRPSYRERLRDAVAWEADALISLHVDARGRPWDWSAGCWRNDDTPGFAVLVADRGAEAVAERVGLARAVAGRMQATGFLPYDGGHYSGLYARDATDGVFLDRRVLFMLRRPPMPSVILEAYHGLDHAERARWQEERTREAFAQALASGLLEAL